MRRRPSFALLGAVCVLFSWSAESVAEPSAAERALEAAYEADGLFARGKWAEAHDRFAAADALAHSPVFVLYMARARRNSGALVEARRLYERVLGERLAAGAPKPFREALADAAVELEEVKAKTPRARVQVRGRASDVTVKLDDAPLAIDLSTPLDPGSHVIIATSGERVVRREVTLTANGEETVVVVDFDEKAALPLESAATEGSFVPGIITLSVGGVGLALGAVTGALAMAGAAEIKEGCLGNHCLEEDADALSTTNALATTSTVSFIAGGACVVAGIVLLAVRPGGEDSSTTVSVGPSGVWVRGSF